MVALEKMFDSRTIQRDFEQSMDYYENKAPKELLDKFTGELLNEFSQLEYGPIKQLILKSVIKNCQRFMNIFQLYRDLNIQILSI